MREAELAIRDLDFEAVARFDGVATVRLTGSADRSIAPQLASLLGEMHEKAVASGTTQIAVDIRELEFMNASCFNVLVAWVTKIGELPPQQRYRLQFTTNATIRWQRRSLHSLSCFATDVVEVEH